MHYYKNVNTSHPIRFFTCRMHLAGDVVRRRQVHPDTIPDFGHFRLTFSDALSVRYPFGRWQATCPYHARNEKTGCTRTRGLPDPSEEAKENTKQLLMYWCTAAGSFARADKHNKFPIRLEECPPEELLWAKAIMMPVPPTSRELMCDDFLDALKKAAEDAAEAGDDSAKKAMEEDELLASIEPAAAAEPAAEEPPPDAPEEPGAAEAEPAVAAAAETSSSSSKSGSSSSSSSDSSSS